MVRYCIAIRGGSKEGATEVFFSEKEVDIFHKKEQPSEEFLCDINPKGQVPALTSSTSHEPLYDSVKITYHIADLFPSLMPESHREHISRLIEEIHSINFFSLTFAGKTEVANSIKDEINQRLKGDISPGYEQALKYKMKVQESEKINGLDPEYVKMMIEHARRVM